MRRFCFDRREFCKAFSFAVMGFLPFVSLNEPCEKLYLKFRKEKKMAYVVEINVISQKGTCALGHKIGDSIRFTETGVDGRICIHALYSILPKVFAMMYGAQFPWLENPDRSTSACPDAYNPVVFEIIRKKDK